jgi:hypothetical protein
LALLDYIITNNVSGVFTGASEFNILNVRQVCKMSGLPFYATDRYWDISFNKDQFVSFCRQNKISVPNAISLDQVDTYLDKGNLLIVKPVDASSCNGISVCKSSKEVNSAIEYALKVSIAKKYVIEEYLEGDEFSVHYAIQNGVIRLIAMMDKYHNSLIGSLPIPEGYIYPSKYLDDYYSKKNNEIISVLDRNNWPDGVVFFQGIKTKKDYVFFEMGFRVSGTAVYNFTSVINGTNVLRFLLSKAVGDNCSNLVYDVKNEDPFFKGRYAANLSIFVKPGKITRIKGIEMLRKDVSVKKVDIHYNVGDTIKETKSLGQIFIRTFIVEDSLDKLEQKINEIHNLVRVYSDDKVLNVEQSGMFASYFSQRRENF